MIHRTKGVDVQNHLVRPAFVIGKGCCFPLAWPKVAVASRRLGTSAHRREPLQICTLARSGPGGCPSRTKALAQTGTL